MDLVVALLMVKIFTFLLHFLPENLVAVRVQKVARWSVLLWECVA